VGWLADLGEEDMNLSTPYNLRDIVRFREAFSANNEGEWEVRRMDVVIFTDPVKDDVWSIKLSQPGRVPTSETSAGLHAIELVRHACIHPNLGEFFIEPTNIDVNYELNVQCPDCKLWVTK
jgi:hypothetical protein